MDHHGWNVIDADAGILWREYFFSGKARATTLIFRGMDGGLVVVSPPSGLAPADYDSLREFGEVRALIANNSFHHLGQVPWRARFPDAVSYAPAGAIPRLSKKAPSLAYRPLTELRLPPQVRCEPPPGFKTGETILSVTTAKGPVWYTGDLLTNIVALPAPPLRWLMTMTDSAPGFRLFAPAVWFAIKSRQAVHDWMMDRLAKDPPTVVVPAHGKPVQGSDVARQAKEQVARLV